MAISLENVWKIPQIVSFLISMSEMTYLIGFTALIDGQIPGPFGARSRRRQQIDGLAVRPAQFALAL